GQGGGVMVERNVGGRPPQRAVQQRLNGDTGRCLYNVHSPLLARPHPRASKVTHVAPASSPVPPWLCASATFAPSTCRPGASPRSCQTSSQNCATPVAPSG